MKNWKSCNGPGAPLLVCKFAKKNRPVSSIFPFPKPLVGSVWILHADCIFWWCPQEVTQTASKQQVIYSALGSGRMLTSDGSDLWKVSLVEVWWKSGHQKNPSFLYHEYDEFVAGHLRFVARSSWSFGLAIQRPKAWVDNVSCQGKNLVVLQYLQQQFVFCSFFFNLVEPKW